jgi:hypothetical protein
MASPSTSSADTQVLGFLLLSLPKELQTKILALVLHRESITPSIIELRLNPWLYPQNPNFLAISIAHKQLKAEAIPILFSSNAFKLTYSLARAYGNPSQAILKRFIFRFSKALTDRISDIEISS